MNHPVLPDLKAIIDQLPAYVYWKDLTGKILGCNQLQAESLGFASTSDLIGKNMYDLFPKAQAEAIINIDNETIQSNKAIIRQETATFCDKKKYILSIKAPLKNNEGACAGLIGISLDITGDLQRRMQEFQILENIIALMPGHVYWKDLNDHIIGCNLSQAQFCGFNTREELIGKTSYDLLPKEVADTIISVDQTVIHSQETITQYESTTIDDTDIHFISKKAPLKNAQGEVEGIVGISFDVTSEYRAQLQKFQMYEHIISLVPAHVYWKDLNGKYLGCNDQQAKMAGFKSRDDIIGKTDFDMPWKAAAEAVQAMDKLVIATQANQVQEETGLMADGLLRTYLSHKSPLKDDRGNLIGIVGVSVDISQQKEVERLKAERAQVSKLVAASIAHEIRTPLASVSFIASTLDTSLTELADELRSVRESHPELLAQIPERKLQQLLALPDKLQSITTAANTFIDMMLMKVDLEKAKPQELITLSMAQCIAESVELYPLTDSDRALLQVELAHDFVFQGDPILMRHVFFNLIKNALHYVKAAGKGEISIWMESTPTEHQLHFKDTGTGIPAEILPHIFSTFFSKTRHGTGVGLALCKVIVEESGGTIRCESIQGEYSHFVISFPHQPH